MTLNMVVLIVLWIIIFTLTATIYAVIMYTRTDMVYLLLLLAMFISEIACIAATIVLVKGGL